MEKGDGGSEGAEVGGRAGEYDELDMHYSISEAAWKLERGPHRKQ